MPRILSLLCILWATVCHAVSPSQSDSSEPTCAFLSANPSIGAGLTEAKLLERGCGRWLERREIDGILEEQELAASFTPSSPTSRIALGRILKADVLVLMRTDEEGINLVVAETNGGLRILARSVPKSSDPEADSENLTNLVAKAIAEYKETIRKVCAVPPFLSRDLGTDNNHLMTAYATLVERVLLVFDHISQALKHDDERIAASAIADAMWWRIPRNATPDVRQQSEIESDYAMRMAYRYAERGLWDKMSSGR